MRKTKETRITKKTTIWKTVIVLTMSLIAIGLLLTGATPDKVGPVGITVFFILVYVAIMSTGLVGRRVLLDNPSSISLLLVIMISASLISLLALNTINLNSGDYILLGLFVSMFMLYWIKLRQQ